MDLTIKEKAIELFNVQTIDEFKKLTHHQVYTTLLKIPRFRGRGETSFKKKLNNISEEYGTFVSFLYLFYEFSLHAESGGYVYLYEIGIIGDCDNTAVIDPNIFKDYYYLICIYFNTLGFNTDFMQKHFDSVSVCIDEREDIGIDDPEFELMIKKIEAIQNIKFSENSKMSNIKFRNPNIGEIINGDELDIKHEEMIYFFNDGVLNDAIRSEFDAEFAKLFDKKFKIILHIGSEPEQQKDLYHTNIACYNQYGDITYYRDKFGHPKKVIDEFKEYINRIIANSDNKAMAIITCQPDVVNYIRYLVWQGRVQLHDEKFCYVDVLGERHINKIDKHGKFVLDFPSGFFDNTLEELLQIG